MPEKHGLQSVQDLMSSGMVMKGDDPNLVVNFLPTGITALDNLLGGGFGMGRCTLGIGPESTGKTLLSQICAAAVQRSPNPIVLYVDLERSFDRSWWEQSGVDVTKLLVSTPESAEKAIDIIRAMLLGEPRLGMVIVDSLAAMVPAPEMDPEKSSEDKTIGLQAKVITLMYRQIVPLLDNRVIVYVTNQMRENIGGYEDLGALPGGRAQRHYSHVILKTRRESWIKDSNGKTNKGYYMEITSRKNKLCSVPDGTVITLPFLFNGQIDMLTSYLEEAVRQSLVTRRGPYYYWREKSFLGMPNLRQHFIENPELVPELQAGIQIYAEAAVEDS